MAKYLVIGSYTAEGAAGVLREGGSGRREAARQAVLQLSAIEAPGYDVHRGEVCFLHPGDGIDGA